MTKINDFEYKRITACECKYFTMTFNKTNHVTNMFI